MQQHEGLQSFYSWVPLFSLRLLHGDRTWARGAALIVHYIFVTVLALGCSTAPNTLFTGHIDNLGSFPQFFVKIQLQGQAAENRLERQPRDIKST